MTKGLMLYEDGKKVGEAKKIRLFDNAHVKRRSQGNRYELVDDAANQTNEALARIHRNTISFSAILRGGKEYV